MSVCTSVVKVEEVPNLGDLLKVEFNDQESALWFFSYADALQYVNQPVLVEFRNDIYKGNMTRFIHTFTVTTVVQTLDKSDNIKLFCDQSDNFANLSFSEIASGENRDGCIVFCTHQEYKSSNNAVWMELIIRDRTMHTAKCRIFDYETLEADFAGKYIITPLSRNKYGFTSTFARVVNGECPPNPEISIAKEYIKNYFSMDIVSMECMQKTNLLGALEEHVDYERGYGLMRLAMELSMVDAMHNITKDIDLQAIGQALMLSYIHITRTSVLSPTLNNVFLANQFQWPNKVTVMRILDECAEEHPAEYSVYKNIKNTVHAILEVRKGTTF